MTSHRTTSAIIRRGHLAAGRFSTPTLVGCSLICAMVVMRGITVVRPVLVNRLVEAGLDARNAPANTGHHERKRRDDRNEMMEAVNHNVKNLADLNQVATHKG
jgi:hypothetical protein